MDVASSNDRKHKIRREIRIEPDMYYSEAFNALSASALRTLMRCLQKRSWDTTKRHGSKKPVYIDGEFIFPYSEAKSLGIGTTQFCNNMAKLRDVGFIDLTYQGGRYQKDQHEKDYSRYRHSDRWKKYNMPDFQKAPPKPKVLKPEHCIREHLKQAKTKPTSRKRSCQLHESEVVHPKKRKPCLHESEVDPKVGRNAGSLVRRGRRSHETDKT